MATKPKGIVTQNGEEKDHKKDTIREDETIIEKDLKPLSEEQVEKTEITTGHEQNANESDIASDHESESFEDALEDVNGKLNECKVTGETTGNEEDNEEDEYDEEHVEPDEHLTPEEKEERKKEAEEYKNKGNEYFKNSEYPEARELYTRAIQTCPSEFGKDKSIFYSNRAACLVRMECYKDAIKNGTKALELNPEYLKARLRRAQCYEHEDQLEEALEDYQKVFEADKSSLIAREALMRLPEQIKIKHEKMKEEMLGKLKDLGNVFLKPFGLSTDNFKMQQDPNSGGYNINFQK